MEDQSGCQLPPRKFPRYKALQRTLVFFKKDPEGLPHHILDICEGGLSFSYLGDKIELMGVSPVSLYHEYELIVEDIPVKEVSDYQLRDSIVPVRRGSLCFESLTFEQQKKLSTFIERYTELLH